MSSLEQVAEARLLERVEAERAAQLAELLTELHAEQERDAKQARQAAELEAAGREADRLAARRDAALLDVRLEAPSLAASVTAFLAAERELETATLRAGRSYKRLDETVAELCLIALRDAGLICEPVPFIPAAWANRLRDQYPLITRCTDEMSADTQARCTVCSHPERDRIEQALAAGESYRPLAATYGLSKSALYRHRQHLLP